MAIHKAAVVLALASSSAHYVLANPIVARDTSTSASQNALSVLCAALTTSYSLCPPSTTAVSTTSPQSGSQPATPSASPTEPPAPPQPKPTPSNCANGVQVGDGTASCWTDLGLENYINNWWSSNSGKCNGQGFAQCWYQLQTPYSPTTCDAINGGTSCTNPKWADFPSTSANSAENFFVTWAVYNTYTLFQNLYTSINDAQTNVESQVGSVITLLDPPDPASGSTPAWEYILDALTFGLSLYSEGTILVKAAIRSLPQSTSLITKVYPEGDVSGDVTSWAQVAGAIGQFCQTWAKDIASALPNVADDVPTFVAFAGAGQLTGGVTDLSSLTGALTQTASTYTVSAAAQALGYIITRTAFVDVHLLQQNTSLQWDTGCGAGYDGGGFCAGNFFYDGLDTYSLVNPTKMQHDQTDVFSKLFEGDSPLTTGELFFTGAYQCGQSCGANGGCKPSQGADDITTFSCLSSVKVCTWVWNPDESQPVEDPIFNAGCSNDDMPKIFTGACSDTSTHAHNCVPRAYVGPLMFSSEKDLTNGQSFCNTGCTANYS